MNPSPGEIYLIDFGYVGKKRPAVVVSRQDSESPRAICIVAPITSEYRGSSYEVSIGRPRLFREPESWVNVQALASVGHHMLEKSLGRLSAEQLDAVKRAERFALDL